MAEVSVAAGDRYAPAHGVSLREAFQRLAARRVPELRRAGRPDRGHAPHPGRGEALDFGSAISARAQLLHAAAGARGAAARDLYRLADAPHAGRHHGRRAVRHSRHHRDHGAELRLCRLRQRAGDRGAVLRAQGGGARDRAGGRVPHRQALAQEQRDGVARGRRVRRHLLFQHPVPHHHPRRGADRLCRRLERRRRVSDQERPWRRQARRWRGRQPPRRRASRRTPARRVARALRVVERLARAVARSGDRDHRHVGQRQRLQPDRDLLQQDGDGDLRRRLRGARLRRAAGGRELRLAQARRDARRPRHGRNHARGR